MKRAAKVYLGFQITLKLGVVVKPTESLNLHAKRNLHINKKHIKDPDQRTESGGPGRESNWFTILASFLSYFLTNGSFSNLWDSLVFF